ncbi:hypothetical protein ABT063_05935 [Streptomyces sp. NPDC002838]|uniref:hypothetical protein n=1 Tax=Streptomyces sp. NPDC002838 TaxID=3154436 RepID=UPI00332605F8
MRDRVVVAHEGEGGLVRVVQALAPDLRDAGIAAGAALGGLVLPLAGVRGTFLMGGLLTVGACAVLLGERLLSDRPARQRH